MSVGGFEWSILAPAFLAGLLVLATHVPLGRQVLARGIVFIDLALAQLAGLGAIAAHALGLGETAWAVQGAALLAALLGGLLLTWTEGRWAEIQEALIGVLFVVAACVALLLLAGNPHAGEHLKDLLVGQILWVGYPQLLVAALPSALALGVWRLGPARLGRAGFYLPFALAVTASVQLVGVYLVFASLILPALATRHRRCHADLMAGAVGAAGYLLGLLLSALADLPAGPLIVLGMAGVALLVAWAGAAPRPLPGADP